MKHRNIILGAILSALAWFGPLPAARAVVPAPDGGYPNWNTAEGTNALFHLTSGVYNTALGGQALFSTTGGGYNTAVGLNALYHNNSNYNTANGFQALFSNTTGTQNTATGANALLRNTTGNFNTANGVNALYQNTIGSNNTASGVQALFRNTSGTYNTASGYQALYGDTTGNGNTGSGYQALFSNQTGANNAAYGYVSLYNNKGSFNAAFGSQTLVYNTTGSQNTAAGYQALVFNTIGYNNIATGYQALYSNRTGHQNIASGFQALYSNTEGYSNTAIGDQALHSNTGTNNTALGFAAGASLTTECCNIDIGNSGVPGESSTIRIGDNIFQTATYIAGINGKFVGVGGTTCYVDNAGKLGVSLSARRFKTDIADMGDVSEALLALRPVTFHYKPELDKTGIPQFGLIAEEVAKVNPDLVTHDAKGELSTVRYEAVNAMLLNEFLKEHRKVEEQAETIAKLTSTVAQQRRDFQATIAKLEERVTARLQEQAAQIQKVGAQLAAASPSRGGLEANKPVPKVVNNP